MSHWALMEQLQIMALRRGISPLIYWPQASKKQVLPLSPKGNEMYGTCCIRHAQKPMKFIYISRLYVEPRRLKVLMHWYHWQFLNMKKKITSSKISLWLGIGLILQMLNLTTALPSVLLLKGWEASSAYARLNTILLTSEQHHRALLKDLL